MQNIERRYDIDWLRVIAIGLLVIYHVAIAFQPWGGMIGFITAKNFWTDVWFPMSMLNIWRIPLLFYVSGMGVFFALQRRTWSQLLVERSQRILVPFIFGIFVIVPLYMFILQSHFKMNLNYVPHPGHLWFLGNIFAYVLLLSPLFFYLIKNPTSGIAIQFKKIFATPLGLLIPAIVMIAEAEILNPRPFELYAMTWHGFFLGLFAFFFGFCFVYAGLPFRKMIERWWFLWLILAMASFIYRSFFLKLAVSNWMLSLESLLWVMSMLAMAGKLFHQPSKTLSYLSEAAYPIYILHMIFLYEGSHLFFNLDLPAPVIFLLVLIFTLVGCFATFELIRRIKLLRPLFGLKMK